jgi:hypothetical protein
MKTRKRDCTARFAGELVTLHVATQLAYPVTLLGLEAVTVDAKSQISIRMPPVNYERRRRRYYKIWLDSGS